MRKEVMLGETLRNLRKESGYSLKVVQELLAKRGQYYCSSTIYKWEEGTILPDIIVVGHLCEIYQINVNYLFTHEGEPTIILTDLESFVISRFRSDRTFRDLLLYVLAFRFHRDRISQKTKKKLNEIFLMILRKDKS